MPPHLQPSLQHLLHRLLAHTPVRSPDHATVQAVADLLLQEVWSCPSTLPSAAEAKPAAFSWLDQAAELMQIAGEQNGSLSVLESHLLPVIRQNSWTADYPDHPILGECFAHTVLHRSEILVIGCNLLAPDTLYPAHAHLAEEIYIPLTGSRAQFWQENHPAGHVGIPGDIIYHASEEPHALTTANLPVLNLWFQFGDAPGGPAWFVP